MQNQAGAHQLEKASAQKCPQCHTTVPVHTGFVSWCNHCKWNVMPHEMGQPQNAFEALYQRIGSQMGKGLFDRMSRAQDLRPTLTPSKVAAFIVAGLVHSFSLLLFVGGVAIVISAWPHIFVVIVGLFLVAMSWVLRPHIQSLPTENLASREDFRALYNLADRVSEALDARKIDIIVLDDDFNAGFTRAGWSKKDVVYLGLPLFAILKPQERVALLGHEIAHGANGDPTRSFFVGSAVYSLNRWYMLLHPDELWDPRGSIITIISTFVSNLVLFGLSQVAKFWLYLLAHLLFRDMQRAEYLADHMAAQASGTQAQLGMLQKIHMADTVQMTIRRFYLNNANGNLFDVLKAQVANVPKRELERIEQVERILSSRLDATHPPTAYRIDLLNTHVINEPKVVLSEDESRLIDVELKKIEPEHQATILNEQTDSSYY